MYKEESYAAMAKYIDWINDEPVWNRDAGGGVKEGSIAGTINSNGYRVISLTANGSRMTLRAHRLRFFMEYGTLPDIIDHINGDRSDNRIENLRESTASQNQHNSRGNLNASSKYKGVSWYKPSKKWKAQISIDGKVTCLGSFTSELEAAKAYNDKARELHGEFYRENVI